MAAGEQAPYPEVEEAIVARARSLARTWQAADADTASAEGEVGEAGPVQKRPASGDERPRGALRAAPPRKELPAAIPDPYSPDDLAAAGLEPTGELAWPDDEPRPLADLLLRRRPSGGRP